MEGRNFFFPCTRKRQGDGQRRKRKQKKLNIWCLGLAENHNVVYNSNVSFSQQRCHIEVKGCKKDWGQDKIVSTEEGKI